VKNSIVDRAEADARQMRFSAYGQQQGQDNDGENDRAAVSGDMRHANTFHIKNIPARAIAAPAKRSARWPQLQR